MRPTRIIGYKEMKKTHLIIVMLSLLVAFISFVTSMPVAAQTTSTSVNKIRNTFYNCTLGVSTKSEVLTKLNAQGYTVKKGYKYLYIENVTFAGIYWKVCSFVFYKDKLCRVSYGLERTDPEEVKNNYNDILGALSRKYGQFPLKIAIDTESDKNKFYDDGNTMVAVAYNITSSGNFNSLLYIDKGIALAQDDDMGNDL